MSQSAIATGIVDRVWPPQEIAQTLNQKSDRAGATELLSKTRKLHLYQIFPLSPSPKGGLTAKDTPHL